MIKTVFLASLAAVALCAPDADPAILYGGTKILTPPTPFIHNPPVRHVVAAPLPYGYGIGAFAYGKRDADADPAILAGSTQVLTPPTPLIHNPPVLPVVAAAPLAYGYGIGAGYGLGVGAYGLHHGLGAYGLHNGIGKRDADADPQFALAAPYYAHAPFAFASAGAIPHVPVVKSVELTPAEINQEVTAHAIPIAVGYGHGFYHGYGKREAEADPQYGYGLPALPYAGPVAIGFHSAGAVPHLPVVKSIEETAPAEVNHEVTAHAIPVAVGFGGYAHHGYAGHFYG